MIEVPKGTQARWARSVVLSVRDGKLHHSGQAKPVIVRRTRGGLFVGCTFVTTAALHLISRASTENAVETGNPKGKP